VRTATLNTFSVELATSAELHVGSEMTKPPFSGIGLTAILCAPLMNVMI